MMVLLQKLAAFALREAARQAVGPAASLLGERLQRHFTDGSQALPNALSLAYERAWVVVELGVAGDSLQGRWQRLWQNATVRGLAETIDQRLHALTAREGPAFRRRCAQELAALRRSPAWQPRPTWSAATAAADIAADSARFAQYAAGPVLAAQLTAALSQALTDWQTDYPHLCTLLTAPLSPGMADELPLLVAAFGFFLRQEISRQPQLAADWQSQQLDAVHQHHQAAFTALAAAFDDQVLTLNDQLSSQLAAHHGALRQEVQTELQRITQWLHQIGAAHGPLQPSHTHSLVSRRVDVLRWLETVALGESPALDNAVGKLLLAVGEAERAQRVFSQLAQADALRGQRLDQAQASYNGFRAALEHRDFGQATEFLQQAVHLAPEQFAPFDLRRYALKGILGAGAFGVAFDCEHRHLGDRIVIKSFYRDAVSRPIDEVFNEARLLRQLDHPSIIRIEEFDFVDPACERPYLVMRHFDGVSLDRYLQAHGCLDEANALTLAVALLEALAVAHQRHILHRDLKPENLLVRRAVTAETPANSTGWEIKLIDFGLALSTAAIQQGTQITEASARSLLQDSVAGTLKYAPPEQMGELRYPIGPYSDLFAWAKTLCVALFDTPTPTIKNWRQLAHEPLIELLNDCLEKDPQKRPQTVDAALAVLRPLAARSSTGLASTPGDAAQSLRDELRESVAQSLRDELRDSIAQSLRDELRDSVAQSLRDELRDSIAQSLRDELRAAATRTVPPKPRDGIGQTATFEPLPPPVVAVPPGGARPPAPSLDHIHGWDQTAVQALQQQTAASLGLGRVQRDRLRDGASGPALAVVPMGSFVMGSPSQEVGHYRDESPHRVEISAPFLLGVYSTTFAEFDLFCRATGRELLPDQGWGRDHRPVVAVTWHDALDFCDWLATETGHPYRLPTEAEWEYACRAGTVTPFWWGHSLDVGQANYQGDQPYHRGPIGEYRQKTVPVGQFQANPWGLYQMHGNVWEWTGSVYHRGWQEYESQLAYRADVSDRALRGGAWNAPGVRCRAAARWSQLPTVALDCLSFRVARDGK